MIKYEYKVQSMSTVDIKKIQSTLNNYGNDGWELSAVPRDYFYIFKRPLKTTTTRKKKDVK